MRRGKTRTFGVTSAVRRISRVKQRGIELKGVVHMTRLELIHAVSEFCQKLSTPLPPEEMAEGWSELSRAHFLDIFQNLATDLHNNVNVPHFPIVRILDQFGVGGGKMFEEACKLSVALNYRKW